MALRVYFMLLTLSILFRTSVQHKLERSSTTCPDGWTQYQDTCYRYVREWVTWNVSNARCADHDAILAEPLFFLHTGQRNPDFTPICADQGAILAEPDTDEAHEFLTEIVDDKYIWLGGSDLQTEGTWVWRGSGRPIVSFHWGPGEPNSFWGNQDCLGMSPSDGWLDLDCTSDRSYICAKQSTPATVPSDLLTCPRGWTKFQTTCYLHVEEFITWEKAIDRCADQGAILAEPTTREKFEFLLQTLGWWDIWIGGSDRMAEGRWVWRSSGTPIDPSLWAQSPSNTSPNSGWGHLPVCLHVFKANRLWADGWYQNPCTWEKFYICEKEASE